jgi:hypothetical protein
MLACIQGLLPCAKVDVQHQHIPSDEFPQNDNKRKRKGVERFPSPVRGWRFYLYTRYGKTLIGSCYNSTTMDNGLHQMGMKRDYSTESTSLPWDSQDSRLKTKIFRQGGLPKNWSYWTSPCPVALSRQSKDREVVFSDTVHPEENTIANSIKGNCRQVSTLSKNRYPVFPSLVFPVGGREMKFVHHEGGQRIERVEWETDPALNMEGVHSCGLSQRQTGRQIRLIGSSYSPKSQSSRSNVHQNHPQQTFSGPRLTRSPPSRAKQSRSERRFSGTHDEFTEIPIWTKMF